MDREGYACSGCTVLHRDQERERRALRRKAS